MKYKIEYLTETICVRFTGFLSQLIRQQSYETCIKYGIWAASEVIQKSGCVLNANREFSI